MFASKNELGPAAQSKNCRNNHNIQIWGHRAMGFEGKNNTTASFTQALLSGMQGIEIDVWLTRDNVPVILHGDTTNGVAFVRPLGTDGEYKKVMIKNLLFSEFSSLEYKKTKAQMPSLEDLLRLYKDSNLIINVEIKDPDTRICSIILDEFISFDLLKNLRISSFLYYHQQCLQEAAKSRGISCFPFGYLMENFWSFDFKTFRSNFVSGDILIVPFDYATHYEKEIEDKIAMLKDIDVLYGIYYPTIYKGDDSETVGEYRMLLEMGFSIIITNMPSRACLNVKKINGECSYDDEDDECIFQLQCN